MARDCRVLFVLSNPGVGGTETFLLAVGPYLGRGGCRVDIVNLWPGGLMKQAALDSGLGYMEPGPWSRRIPLAGAASVLRAVRRNRCDVVMGFGLRVSLLLRGLKPLLGRRPVLAGLRGLDEWRRWYHTWADRLTECGCDLFVGNSRAVVRRRMEREKTPERKLTVILNGVDCDYFDRSAVPHASRDAFGLPADKVLVTTVGNLRRQKGHDFLLDVLAARRDELAGVHCAWAGRGSLREPLEQKAAQLGLVGTITFLGHVDDVRALLACTDILVMPSREEGMPRCVLEAMAMGVPCVATDVGGTAEVIVDGESGLVADFGDVQGFGGHLVRLVGDEALRRTLGDAARRRVVGRFGMERIAQQYLKLFDLVLKGRRDGREIQRLLDAPS